MKNIWIRSNISGWQKAVFTLAAVLLVLVIWLSLSTIRKPASTIKQDVFENQVLANLYFDEDRALLENAYALDSARKLYRRNSEKDIPERISVYEALRQSGAYYRHSPPNPVLSPNVLPHPLNILKSFPNLFLGISEKGEAYSIKKSLIYAIWISLRRELIAFLLVILIGLPLGVLMSCSQRVRSFFTPALVVGTFIPIAALIPLSLAFFGIGEEQKVIFLALGMFFVLLGLVIKEIDEVDSILLHTGYTLGFSQWKTILFILVPTALPRIWKHLAAVFGLGWGYIIFAEMINSGGQDIVNGIGWLFIARQRRFRVADMYAIFFIIIFLAFVFSWLFKAGSRLIFKHERYRK